MTQNSICFYHFIYHMFFSTTVHVIAISPFHFSPLKWSSSPQEDLALVEDRHWDAWAIPEKLVPSPQMESGRMRKKTLNTNDFTSSPPTLTINVDFGSLSPHSAIVGQGCAQYVEEYEQFNVLPVLLIETYRDYQIHHCDCPVKEFPSPGEEVSSKLENLTKTNFVSWVSSFCLVLMSGLNHFLSVHPYVLQFVASIFWHPRWFLPSLRRNTAKHENGIHGYSLQFWGVDHGNYSPGKR